jgi:hypothetical protein
MGNVQNEITYTVYSATAKAHVEATHRHCSTRKLTIRGAQRIVREIYPTAIVSRVECWLLV